MKDTLINWALAAVAGAGLYWAESIPEPWPAALHMGEPDEAAFSVPAHWSEPSEEAKQAAAMLRRELPDMGLAFISIEAAGCSVIVTLPCDYTDADCERLDYELEMIADLLHVGSVKTDHSAADRVRATFTLAA